MSEGMYGLLSIVLGGIVSVIVARISRPTPPASSPVSLEKKPTALDGADLKTVPGLAAVLIRQETRIGDLETQVAQAREHSLFQDRVIAALRRYALLLEGALTRSGTPVPEPEDGDKELIRG
ncbi:hypothetical protein ACFWN1_17345 [Streptomyces sp. NPDC058459]|uniref:hypothetical protein n=1 Tax=Streptomyces sp. NPDC058459 TaxID=3346508 RepID=UPI003656059C